VILVQDDPGVKAVAEEMSGSPMPPVEQLRVDTVEPLNSGRKGAPFALEDEVVVRSHEAVGVTAPPAARHDVAQEPQERESVHVVPKDPFAGDTARGDVEEAVGKFSAPSSCDGST
jgi:hypothetical protein